jgi:hypothetical protein
MGGAWDVVTQPPPSGLARAALEQHVVQHNDGSAATYHQQAVDALDEGLRREGGVPIDKYHDALLTPKETARHLQLLPSTLNYWLKGQAAGETLVHRVPPVKRGWPSVPFIAVIEAYVLRSLRDLGLSKRRSTTLQQQCDASSRLPTGWRRSV